MDPMTDLFMKLVNEDKIVVADITRPNGERVIAKRALTYIMQHEKTIEDMLHNRSDLMTEIGSLKNKLAQAETQAANYIGGMRGLFAMMFGKSSIPMPKPKAFIDFAMAGQKIEAIKVLRTEWNLGLVEAKMFYEVWLEAVSKSAKTDVNVNVLTDLLAETLENLTVGDKFYVVNQDHDETYTIIAKLTPWSGGDQNFQCRFDGFAGGGQGLYYWSKNEMVVRVEDTGGDENETLVDGIVNGFAPGSEATIE